MKSTRMFLICMLCTVGIYLLFDILKSTVFLINYHGLFIQLKEIFVMVAGIITMYLSLSKKVFKIFLVLYAVLFSIYGSMKLLQFLFSKFGNQLLATKLHLYSLSFLNHTQLFGISPYVFFFGCLWIITRLQDQQKPSNKN